MVLFTLAASSLMLNTTITLNSELWRKPVSIAFENDVRNGMPIPLLVSKYASLTHHDHEKIEYYLKALRERPRESAIIAICLQTLFTGNSKFPLTRWPSTTSNGRANRAGRPATGLTSLSTSGNRNLFVD